MNSKRLLGKLLLFVATVVFAQGCIVVGGYSSERGFWIWPGTLVLLAIGIALFFFIRRRR